MLIKSVFAICLALILTVNIAVASEGKSTAEESAKDAVSEQNKSGDAKQLSGISIVGNDDAPKSLYIVPWKSSEIGAGTSMSMMLNEKAAPVDREVFKRQLDFYEASTKK
jgi:hypothetical protein